MATFLSLTPCRFLLIPRRPSSPPPPSTPHPFCWRPIHKSAILRSSSSPSSFVSASNLIVTEEEEAEAAAGEEGSIAPSSSSPSEPEARIPGIEDPDFRGCKACGREEIEKGCNGEGRIQGGIATVPGFGWWPIKAFRPCPGFVASGGRYRRKGQSMDEVAFGRGERQLSTEKLVKSSSRKKEKGSKRLK